jgi:hypothetical protein
MALAVPGIRLVLLAFLAIRIRAAWRLLRARIRRFDHLAGTAAPGSGGRRVHGSVVFSLNLLLAVLNLIPLPRSTGRGHSFLPRPARPSGTRTSSGPTGAGPVRDLHQRKLFDQLFDPVFVLAINLLFPGVTYS